MFYHIQRCGACQALFADFGLNRPGGLREALGRVRSNPYDVPIANQVRTDGGIVAEATARARGAVAKGCPVAGGGGDGPLREQQRCRSLAHRGR